ncbi:MAG: hypothetical protein GY793_08735 [Proteobacteria bacterium]|nr:hypothetical protein [Pseudomonadota bacterium]
MIIYISLTMIMFFLLNLKVLAMANFSGGTMSGTSKEEKDEATYWKCVEIILEIPVIEEMKSNRLFNVFLYYKVGAGNSHDHIINVNIAEIMIKRTIFWFVTFADSPKRFKKLRIAVQELAKDLQVGLLPLFATARTEETPLDIEKSMEEFATQERSYEVKLFLKCFIGFYDILTLDEIYIIIEALKRK